MFLLPKAFTQEVTNVRFFEDGAYIHIFYDLQGKANQSYFVEVYYSLDKGDTWQGPLKKVTGHVGPDQIAGKNQSITWDVLAEEKSLVGTLQFKIGTRIQEEDIGKSKKIKDDGHRRGYIGLSLGVALPTGDFADRNFGYNPHAGGAAVGAQILCIDFGYLIIKNLGIAACLQGGFNRVWEPLITSDSLKIIGSWKYNCILAGPLFSIPAKNVAIDIRGMLGYLIAMPPYIASMTGLGQILTDEWVSSSAAKIGADIRLKLSHKISWILVVDYLYTGGIHPKGVEGSRSHPISVINVHTGITFRLR